MHRKFQQGSTETLKEFPLGKPLLLHEILFCHISPGIEQLKGGGGGRTETKEVMLQFMLFTNLLSDPSLFQRVKNLFKTSQKEAHFPHRVS